MRVLSGVLAVLLLTATTAHAQSFGIGGRIASVHRDIETDNGEDVDVDSQRFTGGQIRAMISPRTGLELSLDVRSETNELETLRIRQYPIQASLLVFPLKTPFSPYVLGGAGWYTTKVETLVGDETIDSESEREFGWHAGFGAELRMGRHFGLHGDYRYTFLEFGNDDDDDDDGGGIVSRLLPSSNGSMWTAGFTVYF